MYERITYEENILADKTFEDSVIYFFERMDIDKLDLLLPFQKYQNFEKKTFMEMLSDAFNELKKRGNTRLHAYMGKCQQCLPNHKSYQLKGDYDGSHINLLIELNNGNIIDIYECLSYKCDNLDETDEDKLVRIDNLTK